MALPEAKDIISAAAREAEAASEAEAEAEVEDGGVEVVVEDDTPEQDRGRKPLSEDPEPTEDEVEEYSEKVKQRINKMRHGLHDERRAKEAALRERDEAVALAQRILQEKKTLAERNQLGETAYVTQTKERVELALKDAKRVYKEAYEAGDGDALADAQERLAALAIEKQQVEAWARQQATKQKEDETALQDEKTVVQPRVTSTPKAPEPDEDAQKWAAKNTWFNKDKVMTAVALAVHEELVESGIDPREDSSEYYSTLNKRMRDRFPEHQWGDEPRKTKTHTTVAPVGRTTKTTKRVVLTSTQVALARRMGLTPEQYAAEVQKLANLEK